MQQSNSEINSLTSLTTQKWIRGETEAIIYQSNQCRQLAKYEEQEQKLKLTDLLLEWRIMVGITETVSNNEMNFNINWLREEYSEWTCEKIRLAYRAAIKGILDVDVKPYGKMSLLYISSILNAYAEWENPKYRSIVYRKSEYDRLQKERVEALESRRKYIKYYLENLESGLSPDEPFYQRNEIMFKFLAGNKCLSYDHLQDPIQVLKADEITNLTYKPKPEGNEWSQDFLKRAYNRSILIHLVLTEYFSKCKLTYDEITDADILYDIENY